MSQHKGRLDVKAKPKTSGEEVVVDEAGMVVEMRDGDEQEMVHVILRTKDDAVGMPSDGYAAEDESEEDESKIIATRSRRYSEERLEKLKRRANFEEHKEYHEEAEALRRLADLELAATDEIVDLARKEKQLGDELEEAAQEADANGNEGNAAALDLASQALKNAASKTWELGEKAVESAGFTGFVADVAESLGAVRREFGEVFHDNHGTQQQQAQQQESAVSFNFSGFGNFLAKSGNAIRETLAHGDREGYDQQTLAAVEALDYRLGM